MQKSGAKNRQLSKTLRSLYIPCTKIKMWKVFASLDILSIFTSLLQTQLT